MMMSYVIYDSSGRITEIQTTDNFIAGSLSYLVVDQLPIDDTSWNTKYVSGSVMVSKSVNSNTVNKTSFSANGVDEVILSGIPVNSKVVISGPGTAINEIVTDGEVILTTNTTGAYTISVTSTPYFDWSTTVNAV